MNGAKVQGSGSSPRKPSGQAVHRSTQTILVITLAVAAATIRVFWPCLSNGFLHWDDQLYLESARQAGKLSTATVAWAFTTAGPMCYYPLTLLSHVLDWQLWGAIPAGHHATSVVLHGLNAALVVVLVWMLTERLPSFSAAERWCMAGGVGLAFGIHPLQVESVAWLAERQTVLCGLFSLASLCAYLRAVAATTKSAWWPATVVLFVAALLSKPMAVSLPGVMLAMDFFPLRRHQTVGWWRLCREKALLIALSLAQGAVTLAVAVQLGAVLTIYGYGPGERCLLAARGVIFYLWKLIWPGWLSPFYPLGGTVSLSQREFLVPVVLVALIGTATLRARRRAPALLAAWVAFLALILPVSGLLQTGSQAVADRFMYLALLAPLLLAGGGVVWLSHHVETTGRAAGVALVGCGLVFFGIRTREQIAVWHSDETVWTAAMFFSPRSGVVLGHLAQALADQGRFEEALPHARASLADIPDYPLGRATLESVCSTLAMARVERRQFAEALPFTREVVELDPTNAAARAMLGLIDLKTGQFAAAIPELEEAVRLDSDLPAARYNLACAYSRVGRVAEAYRVLQNVLPAQPQFGPLAARDADLAALRDSREYGARVQQLLHGDRAQ